MRRTTLIMSSPTPSHAAYVSTRSETSRGIGTSSISPSSIDLDHALAERLVPGAQGFGELLGARAAARSVTSTGCSVIDDDVRVEHRPLHLGQPVRPVSPRR